MFCPKCKSEYQEGITKCPDCEVDLVEKLDETENEEYLEYVPILKTYNPGDIAIISSLLEGSDIRYFIQGGDFSDIRPLIEPVIVKVEQQRKDDAIELLKDLELEYNWISGN